MHKSLVKNIRGSDVACRTVDTIAYGSMETQNKNKALQTTVRTRHETATLLRLSIRTLDYLIARREIGFCKVGAKLLFRTSDIESFLNRHAVAPNDNPKEIE